MFNTTAVLLIPIGMKNKGSKAETEIQPVISRSKIRKFSL